MIAVSRHHKLRSFSRQRGSTLTGLIIGLIVGLGIAVAVALTITKGASPFTDKTVKAGRPADPAPGQAQDPNKPMYPNRDAAREANKEIAEKAAARTNGAGTDVPAAAKPADADPLGQAIAAMKDTAPAKAEPKPETRVASAAPAPAPAPAAPAAASAAGDYIYYLQAGAFRDLSDAEATRAKLALLGFEAAISDRTSDSGVLHRVRLGPYNQVEAMNKARAKLLDSGVDVAIVRNQR
ncbi:SPOR domain-containing protein [Massilia putida]|uniref:SPOR domain-containing protein n=1 Tax=Massilia putida TaxID=1141883 RepID=UPI000951FB1D|nr:SPOR domain-containing protein [Massilia putida]